MLPVRRSMLVLLLGVVTWASSASAEPSRANRALAQRHFERGMALIEEESWEQALAAFDESLSLYPSQTALYNRAVCLGLMGNPLEATRSFRDLLDRYEDRISDDRRRRATEELERLTRRLGQIHLRVQGPESATVIVDGEEVGVTPLDEPLSVNPGRHQIEVNADEFVAAERWVDVGAGAVLDVSLVMYPVSAPTVTGPEDGGSGDGDEPEGVNSRGLWIGAHTSAGVAVAALGTALGLFLWNRSEYETWANEDEAIVLALTTEPPGEQQELTSRIAANNELQTRIETIRTLSWVMMGLGSAAAAAAVVLYVFAARSGRSTDTALLPTPGGLALVGQW